MIIRTQTPQIDLERILGHKYRDITPLKTTNGAMSELFLASFGEGKNNRVIKVDKSVTKGRPKRYRKSGCDRKNAFRILSKLEEADNHNITTVYDYETMKDGSVITVEKNLKGFQTLYDYVKQDGPLNEKDAKEIFSKVFDAAKYVSENKIFHRDYSPHNIMIRKGQREWEVEVNDFGNATKKGNVKAKFLPTGGNSAISDPFMYQSFVGEEREYNDKAEVFSLGINQYFALTGKLPFYIDPDKGVLKSNITLEKLLGENGQIDEKKYKAELEAALKLVPKKQRGWFRRSLTSPENRFESVEKQAEAFDYANRPGFLEKLKKHWTKLVAAGLITATGMGVLGYQIHEKNQENQRLEQLAEQNDKPLIKGKWDGGDLEICNNGVNLEVRLNNNRKDYEKLYPNKKAPELKRGDRIDYNISLRDAPLPKGKVPQIEMKIYFEGYEDLRTFHLWAAEFDKATYYDNWGYGVGGKFGALTIPEYLPDGIHTLIIEAYAPPEEKEKKSSYYSGERNIRFEKPEQVILQKRIPIVIGNPKEKVEIAQIRTGYMPWISFGYTDSNLGVKDDAIDVETNVHEYGKTEPVYKDKSDKYITLHLPNVKDTKERILEIVARDKQGNILSFDYFPIQAEKYKKTGIFSPYKIKLPDKNFSKEVRRLRENLYKNQSK